MSLPICKFDLKHDQKQKIVKTVYDQFSQIRLANFPYY